MPLRNNHAPEDGRLSISAFHVRSHHRVPVQCPVYFSNTEVHGTGTLWNLSLDGCRVDGNMRLPVGAQFELLILLPGRRASIVVRSAQVAWTRGQEFGLRLLTVPPGDQRRLQQFVTGRVRERVL